MTTTAFAPRFDLSNVFLAPAAPAADHSTDDVAEACFALVKSGPAVTADEVESHVDAVEVTVRWGSQVLSVSHLAQGKSFFVGEGSDLALPEDVLGATRAPIVLARGNGAVVVVPRGAQARVSRRDGESESVMGANEIVLAHGMNVVLEVGATRADGTSGEPITFEIGTVRAGKRTPIGFLASLAGGATGFVGLSFIGHAAIVASLAMFMPAISNDDAENTDRDQIVLMQKYLNASAEREAEQPKDVGPADSAEGGGSASAAHRDESGAAGTTKPVTTTGHMAIKGNDQTTALSPKQQMAMAAEFGMVGLLAASANVDPNAPQSKWATTPMGQDSVSKQGNMWSQGIDDATGYGLGMSGTGEGGGGTGDGVGFSGPLGGMGLGGTGHGPGFGPGEHGGMGIGHGPGGGGHNVKQFTLRQPTDFNTNGRIPKEVIQRIVRQNFGRFRNCYEPALRTNPSLGGRVVTKFTIGRDGSVAVAQDAGSDLPDQNVISCVVRSFNSLSFPAPDGGVATVVYPIVLTPGE